MTPTVAYYPHMPIGEEWIYRLLFVSFVFVIRLQISPPRTYTLALTSASVFVVYSLTVTKFGDDID